METQRTTPTFLQSVASGIKGFIKGGLAGAAVGIAVGGVVGAAAGLLLSGLSLVLPAIGLGAYFGGAILGSIGALAGLTTEVVRSRESASPSANDIVNVAKVSYAQGIATGHGLAQEQQAGQSTQWQDRENQRRAANQSQTPTVH